MVIMEIISIFLIGIPEEIFQQAPVGIVHIVIIGAVDGGRVKAQIIARQRFRVQPACAGAIGHALGVGDIEKFRQSGEGGLGVELAIFKANQYTISV